MRKSQVLLTGAGVAAVVLLFVFGRTVPKPDKHTVAAAAPMMGGGQPLVSIDFNEVLAKAKQNVSADSLSQITSLENKVVRGDVKAQQILVFHQLATAWDSLHQPSVAAHYLGEAAKLENSEKSLTFAANLFLANLDDADPSMSAWQAKQAIDLYDKAIAMDTANVSLQIAQASAYMRTGSPMEGVGKLRALADKYPDNVEVQITLGDLAIQSRQFDKAAARMETLLQQHPDNAQALFIAAEAYGGLGNKEKAIQLLERCKKLVNNPALIKEIDDHIAELK